MWRFIDRFVKNVSNSNRRIRTKDMCGFCIKVNGRIKAKEVCLHKSKISSK